MKKHMVIPLLLSGALMLTGCECRHKEWTEADCTTPRTCNECGVTEGEALGHEWQSANCDTPDTCTRCGLTKGEPLGHDWLAANCDTPKTCSLCGATEGDPVGHVWMDATCLAPKTCAVCGATEGETTQHSWLEATCEEPKTCTVCGETEGTALGHAWSQATLNMPAVCSNCGAIGGTALNYTYGGTGTVKATEAGAINLYQSMSENATVLAQIPSGTMLRCYLPNKPNWYCTTYNDACGYILSDGMSDLINENPTDTSHAGSDRNFDLSTIANASIGSTVEFGEYTLNSEFITKKTSPIEWIVLDKTPTRMLLLADRSLECLQYNDTQSSVTWENCALRKWLNNEFYNAAFSSNEQTHILSSTLSNPANPNGGTAGNATVDKVFLLSYDEFYQYVHKTSFTTTTITYYGYWHRDGLLTGLASDWWLRTTGRVGGTACEVGTNGYPVSNYCCDVTELRDVRPAIWVSLQ